MTLRLTILGLAILALPPGAFAAECPGNPGALGTARILAVDAAATPRVGRKEFPKTLPLQPKEIVLTFDDGPWPGTTDRVLAALRHQCVHATFFMIGRNAAAHPALARQVLAEGHTVGHHSYSHALLKRLNPERAKADIERGFRAVDTALYGEATAAPRTPFFRFPGFASSPALLDWLNGRGIVVVGADVWPGDWNPMSPDRERELTLKRLDRTGGGIVLLHDIQAKTARMLPGLLGELKQRGYHVVQMVPSGAVKHAH